MIKVVRKVGTVMSIYTGITMFVSRAGHKSDHTYNIAGCYDVVADEHELTNLNMLAETRYRVGNTIHIATDGLFEMLPCNIQYCIVAHEVGHLVLEGGIPEDMATYAVTRAAGLCPRAEKIADSMMTRLYGRKAAIKTLLIMAVLYPAGIQEVVQRIIAVINS